MLLCYLCKKADESTLHLFIDCPVVRDIWKLAGVSCGSHTGSLDDWFFTNCANLDSEVMCKVAMICWNMWSSKNNSVFNGQSTFVACIVNGTTSLLINWRIANEVTEPKYAGDPLSEHWSKPDEGRLKVNTDVAIDQEGRRMGLGWVI